MKRILPILVSLFAGGCGGNSSAPPSSPPISPPVPATQSPGGQWLGLDSQARLVNLLISEKGDLRGFVHIGTGMEPPFFTTGTVSVTNGDDLAGAMRGQDLLSPPPINLPGGPIALPLPTIISCSLSGTVVEHTRFTAQISCSDDDALIYDESVVLMSQPGYQNGSSLDAIAGNYTLASNPATNTLNITTDGTVFGMYDNGPSCTVNGLVSIIDDRFSLLEVNWTLSMCTDPFGFAEGAEYDGFAMPSPDLNAPDSYYFLLIRELPDSLSLISVIYDST